MAIKYLEREYFGIIVELDTEEEATELYNHLTGVYGVDSPTGGSIRKYHSDETGLWHVSQSVDMMKGAERKEYGKPFRRVKKHDLYIIEEE